MTITEKLKFLADRAEDRKEFLINNASYVFSESALHYEGFMTSLDFDLVISAELKLKSQ